MNTTKGSVYVTYSSGTYDRNACVSSDEEELLRLCAEDVRLGQHLPAWPEGEGALRVTYFDGEHLTVSYSDKAYTVGVGQQETVRSAGGPLGMGVESRSEWSVGLDGWTSPVALAHSESLSDMLRYESINSLVVAGLNRADLTPHEARYLMRPFHTRLPLFKLSPFTRQLIAQRAADGHPLAQCMQAFCLTYLDGSDEALSTAIALFSSAAQQGVADALGGLAVAWQYGDTGMVNREEAARLLQEALQQGSEYALIRRIRQMVFGAYGKPGDPQAALELIAEALQQADVQGLVPHVGLYYYRACATEQLQGAEAARADFKLAARHGMQSAWCDVAVSVGYDSERKHLVNEWGYNLYLEEGIKHGDPDCMMLHAIEGMQNWDKIGENWRPQKVARYIAALEQAAHCGSAVAAYMLGNLYFYGEYDQPQDYVKAYEWYVAAAKQDNADACEQIFSMVHDHYIDLPPEVWHRYVLKGARLGSRKLLNETVVLHTYGNLQEFTEEIEKYYAPIFDGETDDEQPDDDGRFDAHAGPLSLLIEGSAQRRCRSRFPLIYTPPLAHAYTNHHPAAPRCSPLVGLCRPARRRGLSHERRRQSADAYLSVSPRRWHAQPLCRP